jgi:acyl-CoA synthetase (AMP-forming)/AMP-acid ligase II
VTIPALVHAELRRDGSRPFLTWYDDGSGERIELSVATIANWAVKAANHLLDEYAVDAGDAVAVDAPAHWLGFVAALGIFVSGAALRLDAGAQPAVPGDAHEFMRLVLAQPDDFTGVEPDPDALALSAAHRTWTATELGNAAVDAVREHQLPDGIRVLSTMPLDSVHGLDASLLVPLAAHGSVVFIANADASKVADKASVERATHTAGVDVAGLPRLA